MNEYIFLFFNSTAASPFCICIYTEREEIYRREREREEIYRREREREEIYRREREHAMEWRADVAINRRRSSKIIENL
jgi:hypothetical protein